MVFCVNFSPLVANLSANCVAKRVLSVSGKLTMSPPSVSSRLSPINLPPASIIISPQITSPSNLPVERISIFSQATLPSTTPLTTIVLAFIKPVTTPVSPMEISYSVSTMPSIRPSICKAPSKSVSSPLILHPSAIIVFPPSGRDFVRLDLKTPMGPPLHVL